jgi:NAD/NADP transhydrogenase alpha subunit
MFSKNIVTLLSALIKDGELNLNPEDEITKAMLIAHNGATK